MKRCARRFEARVLALVLLLAGCPYPPDSEMRVVQGSLPIGPSETVSFACYCDSLFGGWELLAGPRHCGGSWMVQGVPGGDFEYGTIDECGRYAAPVARPPAPPAIVVYDAPWGYSVLDGCACGMTLSLSGYPE